MSEHLFKFLLHKIQTIRVCCPKCTGVVELPLDKLAGRYEVDPRCRICNGEFPTVLPSGPPSPNAIHLLGEVITALRSISSHVQFEFVIPDPNHAEKK